MNTVLLTGAAGGIGTRMRTLLKGVYPRLRLSDVTRPGDLADDEEFIEADLGDMAACARICAGVDGIIHLGGIASENTWEKIHHANIVGLYNLYEAARQAGVQRIVFATSNHAIGFYRRRRKIGVDEKVRPDTRYGVSKAFGEALGAMYADKHGMRVLNVRIGNAGDKPLDKRRLSIWVSMEDLAQLFRIGLEHPELHYEIVYGVSDNERSWWDNEPAYRLGYQPTGKAEDHLDEALAAQRKLGPDPIGDLFHGGGFCSMEFDGDVERIR